MSVSSLAGRRFILGFLVVAEACGGRISSRHALEGMASEWREAQHDVAQLDPAAAGDPYEIAPLHFVIKSESEPFFCGDSGIHAVLLVWGCFRAEPDEERLGVIRYVPKEGIFRHEARHAILFALGDSRWPDVGH